MFVKCNSLLLFQSNKGSAFSPLMSVLVFPGPIFSYQATVLLRVVNITAPLKYQILPLIDLKGVTF